MFVDRAAANELFDVVESVIMLAGDHIQDPYRLADDLRADPITWQQRDVRLHLSFGLLQLFMINAPPSIRIPSNRPTRAMMPQ